MAVAEAAKKGKIRVDEVDAGGHHGGGMEQGRDRGGTFHGVGQPDVHGELGAFAHDAAEDQQGRRW